MNLQEFNKNQVLTKSNKIMNIELEILKAKIHCKEYIDMLYIQAISVSNLKSTSKEINDKLIDDFLIKKGYVVNYLLGKRIHTKGFVCVMYNKTYIEVWHDTIKKNNSIFIKESFLTSLPITLNYMEKL